MVKHALITLLTFLVIPLYAAEVSDLKYTTTDGKVTITGCAKKASGKLIIAATIEGKTVTSIGESAFYECRNLTSITIPESVTSIGDKAFFRCKNLSSIAIPDSCVIGKGAFAQCSKLITIVLNAGNTNYTVVNGILYNKEKTQLHAYLAGNTRKEYTIPDSVTNITAYAFSGCLNLTSITIPDSVTSIGADVFSNCRSLTNIRIPNGVTSIGNNAFYLCTSLTRLTIPDGVTSIGHQAFRDCTSLTNITIGEGVTSIGHLAFAYCSLTSITIPDSVTSIGNAAFNYCKNLTSIEVGAGNVNYTGVNGVLFNKEKTTLYTYPRRKTGANYTIPDSVTSIAVSAFYLCTSLTSITIGAGVTSIENSAFSQCTSLTAVTFLGDAPKEGQNIFTRSTPTIYRKPEAKGWGDTFAGRPVKLISEKP